MEHALVQVIRNGRIESLHAGFIAIVTTQVIKLFAFYPAKRD